MENDIEEIVDGQLSAETYTKRGKRVSWTGESGTGASLNASGDPHESKPKASVGPDENGSESMEMNTRPRRRRQSLFSDDDATSLTRQEGEAASEYSMDDEAASRSYSSRLSVSAGLDVSIRDRIRSKFADVYTKAQNRERFSRRLTVLRQKSMVDMRGFEEVSDENIDEKLQRSFQKHDALIQQIPESKPVERVLPPPDVQYDFFTKVYDAPRSAPVTRKSTVSAIGEEDEIVPTTPRAEENDETNQLIKRLNDTEAWAPTVMSKAHVTPFSEQIAKEKMVLFTPSFFPLPRDRTPGQSRRLEEEGLYTPQPVALPRCNINTMEERLLNEPGRGAGWFGEDGKLITVAPTLANFPSRLDTAADSKLDVVYSKAVMARRGVTQGVETYQLDVDLSKLMFTHHPLFSKENVLAMRLMNLYKNYLQRAQESVAQYYGEKLHATTETLHVLTAASDQVSGDQSEQIALLREEAKDLRRQRNKQETLDRQLLQNILHTWNVMKQLRQRQGYVTTTMQLYLKKQEVDADSDRALWEADLMEELQERELTYMEWCQKQLDAFHATQQRDGEEQRPESDSPQPEPPHLPPFDREEVWKQLVKTASKTRRNPGEPIFIPVLGSSAAVTPIDKCPSSEKDRRQEIARTRINMKIYFNELEVCTTPTRPLNSDFCVTFGQVYNLHVYEWPQSIQVKIFETAGVGVAVGGAWEQVAVVCIPVPSVSSVTTAGVNALEEIEFSNPTTKSKTHAGVGSGITIDFQVEGQKPIVPRTSGVLQCSALWGRGKDGTPLVPPTRAEDELRESFPQSMGPASVAAIEELQQMLKTSKFDPNNPENVRLYSIIKDVEAFTKGTSKQLECFRLEPAECELVPEDVFFRNPRFRLLQLRHEQVPEFRNLKMIPAVPKEIPADIFTAYEQRTVKEKEKLELSDMDAYRHAADKYLASVRARVIQRLSTVQQTKSLQDMVNEEPLPTLGSLSLLFEERGRPLNPVRKERKRIVTQNLAGVQVKLTVNIARAFNIPTRDERTSAGARSDTVKPDAPKVEPFVEVSFQGQTARTSVLQGPNPTWNQQLLLDFSAPNGDYSPSSLQTVTDPVIFNMYDRLVNPLPHDDREGDTTIHQQIEKRWLGTLHIPFCTIYYNGKVSGAFRLKVPPILLGYSSTSGRHTDVFPHLHMFVTIDPPLMTPEPIRGRFESIESESFLQYADRWVRELLELRPTRRYVPLIVDTNGRSVFVGRFLRPIRPPPEVEALSADKKAAADLACRIVSMIPFVSDPVLFPGLCDIWGSCDQFLDMSCGDEEEHAVLLWCWLSGLSLPCYLLLGNGIPEGPRSAYIFVQLAGASVLYNASDGMAYNVNDSLCPLRSVGCAVTVDNLWANIQASNHPSTMSFDFNNAAHWRPFFTKAFPNPGLASVQPETLTYYDADPVSVIELQEKIEQGIRERMMLWRPHLITRWNRYAAQILRQLLPLMETTGVADDMEERHVQSLQSLYESYKISGFPLNSGYVAMDRIADTIYATNVYANASPDVEFALAVYVHAYTNNILSVWVYVASLVKRR